MKWTEIKYLPSEDGNRRMVVLSEPDGLRRFEEETLMEDGRYTYWRPTRFSGLYDSAEAAESAGTIELPWLRDSSR